MNAVVVDQPAFRDRAVAADVPTERIHAKPSFNPRIHFEEDKLKELAESIEADGIVQSLAIRPREDLEGHYWIIAGERRWRAAQMAGLPVLPVRIFDVTEDEAHDIASAENGPREQLSPGEEALEAKRMMMRHKDRREAARHLCWKPEKLDARLLLTQGTIAVLRALAERRIELGHAELLSTLPATTQDGTLEEVLKRGVTVQDLRKRIDAFALDLATACFDKHGCGDCPHNTTRQASLFEQNVGEGRCTNRPCFHQKTVEHLSELRAGLRDRFNAVILDMERDRGSWTLLLRRDVGDSQFDGGCVQCAHFGCVISSSPGEAGTVTEDVCFDLTCRDGKIAAHRASSARPGLASPRGPHQNESTGSRPTTQPLRQPTPHGKRSAQPDASRAVQEKIRAIHRAAAGAEVQDNPKMIQVYAALALLKELGWLERAARQDDPLTKRGIQRPLMNARASLLETLYGLDEKTLGDLMAELASRVASAEDSPRLPEETYLPGSRATLRLLAVDLARHFVLGKDFLSVHTKAGIEGLLRESGFAQHYNRHDQSALKRLFSSKHEVIVETAISSDFDFRNFLPKSVRVDNE
jgi:PRTRC genetic system ParB family protein